MLVSKSKTGDTCYQTYQAEPKGWRICERPGDPNYFTKQVSLTDELLPIPTETQTIKPA